MHLKCDNVTKHKLMCLTHNEAKQTEKSEFGAEKGVLEDWVKRIPLVHAHQTWIPWWFFGEIFIGQSLVWKLQIVWLSSDWMVVRLQGGVLRILCSAWNYNPPLKRLGLSYCRTQRYAEITRNGIEGPRKWKSVLVLEKFLE